MNTIFMKFRKYLQNNSNNKLVTNRKRISLYTYTIWGRKISTFNLVTILVAKSIGINTYKCESQYM